MGRNVVRPLAARVRHGGFALAALAGSAGLTAAAPVPSQHPSSAGAQDAASQRSPGVQSDPDAGSRNVVARARMLECGHQWSNMKRAGTASGTWKDFSRGCLAQR